MKQLTKLKEIIGKTITDLYVVEDAAETMACFHLGDEYFFIKATANWVGGAELDFINYKLKLSDDDMLDFGIKRGDNAAKTISN